MDNQEHVIVTIDSSDVELISIQEAASRLKITRASVYHAIKSKRIRSVEALGKQAVYASDVEAYTARILPGKREKEPAPKRPRGRPRKDAQGISESIESPDNRQGEN